MFAIATTLGAVWKFSFNWRGMKIDRNIKEKRETLRHKSSVDITYTCSVWLETFLLKSVGKRTNLFYSEGRCYLSCTRPLQKKIQRSALNSARFWYLYIYMKVSSSTEQRIYIMPEICKNFSWTAKHTDTSLNLRRRIRRPAICAYAACTKKLLPTPRKLYAYVLDMYTLWNNQTNEGNEDWWDFSWSVQVHLPWCMSWVPPPMRPS
jgi:hypothetical protein